jgi:hypothetical protein
VTAFVTVVVVAFVAPLERPGGCGPVVDAVDAVDAVDDAGGDCPAGALLATSAATVVSGSFR